MKYFLLIADGMADAPQAALGRKTPLAAAKTPNMDLLAAHGELGLVNTIPEGCVPGSDSGILTLLGYDPHRYLTGRSALEAAGRGIPLAPGQTACRCNLVTIQDGVLTSSSAGDMDASATDKLLEALQQDGAFSSMCMELNLQFYPLAPYRLLCVGPSQLLDTVEAPPPHAVLQKPAALPHYSPALQRLLDCAHRVLAECSENRRSAGLLPATDLWPWSPGKAMTLPAFSKKYGLQGVMISATPLALGIAALAGLSSLCPAGATGTLHTDYSAKAQAAVRCFGAGAELVCLHVEAPDTCSHDQDLQGKIQAIEAIDAQVLGPVLSYLTHSGEAFRILLLPDHRTLTATGCHDSAPVPWLLYDSTIPSGSGLPYTEAAAEQCGTRIPDGTQLMPYFLKKGL